MSVLSLNADSIFSKVIRIGYEGENVVTQIDFNLKMWIAEYGLGGVTLLVLRHGDRDAYPVPLMIDNGIASWTITQTDTARVGRGAIQLRYVVGEKIKKSPIFEINCANSLDDSDVVPDPYDTWLATLTDLSATVTANAQSVAFIMEDIDNFVVPTIRSLANNAYESAETASQKASEAASSASAAATSESRAKASEDAAQGALAGMTFVGFTVNADGHVLITNSDLLGTTSFELTEDGHMEVTY